MFYRDEMTTQKVKVISGNKQVKICYNGFKYFVWFDMKQVESDFKYMGGSPVKTALVEISRIRNV